MSNKSPWVKGLEIKPPYISLARLHGKIPGLLIWQRKGGYNFYSPLCNPVEAAVGLDEVDIIPDESLLESPARYSEDHGAIKSEILARFKQYLQVGDLDFTENLSHQLDAYAKTLAVLFFQWVIDNRYDWNRATKKAVAAWDNYAEYSIGELYSKFQSLPSNAETVEKKDIERLKSLLRMTDCPECLINGEISFKIQAVSELTGHDKEWAEREIKKYEKSLQEGQEGAKEVNGNCKCSPDEKHGQTGVMCCNRCGLPDEDYWEVPANLAASKDYAKGLLEWVSGKFAQYVPGIWTHTYDKIEYTTTELLKEYDKYLQK
jgi:hypothetical protein